MSLFLPANSPFIHFVCILPLYFAFGSPFSLQSNLLIHTVKYPYCMDHFQFVYKSITFTTNVCINLKCIQSIHKKYSILVMSLINTLKMARLKEPLLRICNKEILWDENINNLPSLEGFLFALWNKICWIFNPVWHHGKLYVALCFYLTLTIRKGLLVLKPITIDVHKRTVKHTNNWLPFISLEDYFALPSVNDNYEVESTYIL